MRRSCSSAGCSSPDAAASQAAGNGTGAGLSTTTKYVRNTTSGAAGNGVGTTLKYMRRIRNSAAGSGLGTTIKVPVTNNCRLICRVFFSCCGSVAWPQATVRAPA
jgi:hypothetical protein